MKLILKNSFHNTECAIYSKHDNSSDAWEEIAGDESKAGRKKYLRIHGELCGSDDCECGIVRN